MYSLSLSKTGLLILLHNVLENRSCVVNVANDVLSITHNFDNVATLFELNNIATEIVTRVKKCILCTHASTLVSDNSLIIDFDLPAMLM